MIKNLNNFIEFKKIIYYISSVSEAGLYSSYEFIQRLKKLSSETSDAGFIALGLMNIIDNELYIEYGFSKKNFIDVTNKDDMVSFLDFSKIDDDDDDNPSAPYISKRRGEIKIGRLITTLSSVIEERLHCMGIDMEVNTKSIENFVNAYKSINIDDTRYFKIVKGDDIAFYYKKINYHSNNGSLGGSCMAEESKKFFKLYTKNPNKVQMIVYLDSMNKVHGRALLWKLSESPCDAKYFMDRIYVNSDSDELRFKNLAKEKGFLYKRYTNANINTNVEFIYNNSIVVGKIKVNLKETQFNYYPFVDTLCFMDSEKTYLSNVPDFEGSNMLHSTGGALEVCHSCNGKMDKNYMCHYCAAGLTELLKRN